VTVLEIFELDATLEVYLKAEVRVVVEVGRFKHKQPLDISSTLYLKTRKDI